MTLQDMPMKRRREGRFLAKAVAPQLVVPGFVVVRGCPNMMLWTAPPPALECAIEVGAVRAPVIRRSLIMQTITTIGLDIAKSVFQVYCVDAQGNVVVRRQLKRRYVLAFFQKLPPCLVGIEACATSHYWSRDLQALGHSVRLMPPA